MVCIMENPNLKWMITRGTPILGNLHMDYFKKKQMGGYCPAAKYTAAARPKAHGTSMSCQRTANVALEKKC